ncbi:MAG: DUF1648 domain-containing protein [Pyrinomonadaceae bacterium]
MTRTRLILILAAAAFVAHLLIIYPGLPPTVASHFDAQGTPNGWMSKEMFIVIEAVILVFVVGEFILVPFFIRKMPNSRINLPNKEYWLSPAHREEMLSIMGRYFEIFGVMVLVLVVVVNQFVYLANVSRTNLTSSIWIVIVAFLLFTIVWLIKLMREFRVNK